MDDLLRRLWAERIKKLTAQRDELLAAMEEATAIADKWWDENGSYCDCIDAMQQTLRSAIAKAKGGE